MRTLQERPGIRPPGAWTFPVPEQFVLSNGLRVQVFRRPGQHVVSIGLSLELPLTAEDRAREGVAALTAAVLDQGTQAHPSTAFADAVEDAGAEFEASIGYSTTQLYLDVPASRLHEALPLLAEAVAQPQLDDADVERERALMLAAIEQEEANSAARADLALRRALVDADFRAARRRGGEPETLATVTGADVRGFHAAHYGPVGATLVVAGDAGDADVRALVSTAFSEWTNPGQRAVVHEAPRPRARQLLLFDRPGSVQADVRMAHFGLDRSDPRWAALQVAVNALGGSFLSRLNAVLREEKGYTYGAHATNQPMRSGGFTAISSSFRNDVVADAVDLVPRLLDVTSAPITADEVDRARTYLVGVQPLQYATASGVCNGVMTLLSAGLPSRYVDELRQSYDRVTPEAATAVAAEVLPPDALTLVVVGDAEALASPLRERGFDVRVVQEGGPA